MIDNLFKVCNASDRKSSEILRKILILNNSEILQHDKHNFKTLWCRK